MFIRGIILAAGASSRMGSNKLAIEINGFPIVETVINNAKNSKLNEVVIVYGKYDLVTNLKKFYNPRYEEGMSTSIIEGMRDFTGDGVMILLGDMPFVDGKMIDALVDAFESCGKNIVVPVYKGKRGNPVVIGKKYFKALLENTGDKGAREIINESSYDVEERVINSEGIFQDIDDRITYHKYK